MSHAVTQGDALEGLGGLRFVGDAVEVLREHDVFESSEIRDEMKLLEDEANFFRAIANQFVFAEPAKVDVIDNNAAGREGIQSAENIDQSSLAGAGRAHEGDPFAGLNGEADTVESAEGSVLLGKAFDHKLRGSGHG